MKNENSDLDLDRKVHEDFCPPTVETSIYEQKAPTATQSDSIRDVLDWIKSRGPSSAHDLPAVISYFIEAYHNLPSQSDGLPGEDDVQSEQNLSILVESCACLCRIAKGNRALLTKILDDISIEILVNAAAINKDCAPHVAVLLKAHAPEASSHQVRLTMDFVNEHMSANLELVMPVRFHFHVSLKFHKF